MISGSLKLFFNTNKEKKMSNKYFGDGNKLGDGNVLGDKNTLGNKNTFGDFNTLGNYTKLGDNCTLGESNKLGNGLKFGKKLTIEGVKCRDLMTMGNVDGTGRQVVIIVHTEGIKIRAGCFSGSLDEFCAKAESENKITYSKVVRAAAEAFEQCVNEKGITGGWDD